MSQLNISRGTSSNGRSAPGFSYYSGGMFYGTAPTGWTSYTHPLFSSVIIKAKQILSTTGATNAGILPNTDNVSNTYTSLCTIGTIGNIINISALVPISGGTQIVQIVTNFSLTGATLALQGAAIAAAINANTFLTGFSATFATATLTLIAPTSFGVYFNTTSPYTLSATGTSPFVFGVLALGVSGTASVFADAYYQISEYYRINPTGNLWVGFISSSSSFQEILALQLASGNLLRQMWIADHDASRGLAANLIATVTSIQSIISLISNTSPVEIVYRPNIVAVVDLSTMPNGQTISATNNIQVLISQDGNAQGNLLFLSAGYSISNLGAKLGTLSASRISSNDAQAIQQNNVSDGIENNIPAFSNGQLLSVISVSLNQQLFGNTSGNLSGYCYVGFNTFPGVQSGTFFSGNSMFVSSSSDYAFMNDNRVWDQITRIIIQAYTPVVNSEIEFNADGVTLSDGSNAYLVRVGVDAITAGMITGINPPYISGVPDVSLSFNAPTATLSVSVEDKENGIVRIINVTNSLV